MIALLLAFTMGFTVQTAHPTNVVVRYKVACGVTGGPVRHATHQFTARTPITRSVAPTVSHANFCRLRVVAWDVKPWYGHNGATPKVHAWVHRT